MNNKEALKFAKEQTHIFGGTMKEFMNFVIPLLEERPQGEWIIHNDYHENCRYGCNQCGNLTNIPGNFCPNCGVRMVKGGVKND